MSKPKSEPGWCIEDPTLPSGHTLPSHDHDIVHHSNSSSNNIILTFMVIIKQPKCQIFLMSASSATGHVKRAIMQRSSRWIRTWKYYGYFRRRTDAGNQDFPNHIIISRRASSHRYYINPFLAPPFAHSFTLSRLLLHFPNDQI
jgi:hypothetical protein